MSGEELPELPALDELRELTAHSLRLPTSRTAFIRCGPEAAHVLLGTGEPEMAPREADRDRDRWQCQPA